VIPGRPLPAWCEPRRAVLEEYANALATAGVERGLVGPREAPRIWERHILNCAIVAEPGGLVGPDATVLDVGSGAGLPGMVWAIVRPDLCVVLLEPLLRRATFLSETVAALGLTSVSVVRDRAESYRGTAEVVTARAVAPMDRLVRWCLPLVEPGGSLLALKGASVHAELASLPPDLMAEVVECGSGPDRTTVAVVHRFPGASVPTGG